MKCPKCHYLGFDTGIRCRNCGYDFSLVTPVADGAGDLDLPLHAAGASPASPDPAGVALADEMTPAPLPLFRAAAGDDAPLLHVPARPRPPIAVRRTPDSPRAKAPALLRRKGGETPLLEFPAPPAPKPATSITSTALAAARAAHPDPETDAPPVRVRVSRPSPDAAALTACAPSARVAAVLVDGALLLAIDLVVVYFTLRMAALAGHEWRLLPVVPLALFLLMVKLAYFASFTAIGGQTIGKMAARIRVVGDAGVIVEPAQALRRTMASGLAPLTLGGTFLPALLARDRRALHDRLARTRVVALPSA